MKGSTWHPSKCSDSGARNWRACAARAAVLGTCVSVCLLSYFPAKRRSIPERMRNTPQTTVSPTALMR